MKQLSLDLEKFILVSSLGVSCLLVGSVVSSDGCSVQSPIWNQQLQSTKSYGSLALARSNTSPRLSINTPFSSHQCR